MSVKLEISLGEAIDKLTILDIKKNKIHDVRKIDVECEFTYLLTELKTYVTKYNYYYTILKRTNLLIWELQDTLRSKNCEQSNYYAICDEILNLNDSRYLVKKKINEICRSNLKEQKGYSVRILDVLLNCDIDTINILNGAIRYYSFFYDEIKILSRSENIIHLTQTFNDDPFITIISVDMSTSGEYITEHDCITVNNSDIKLKLLHSFFSKNNNSKNNNNIYDNTTYSKEINEIYRKLGMNVSIFHDYNHVA